MSQLPDSKDINAVRKYVDAPMTAAERAKFDADMTKLASTRNLAASRWNPENPNGWTAQSRDPKAAPVVWANSSRISTPVTVRTVRPSNAIPIVKPASVCSTRSNLNPKAATFQVKVDGAKFPASNVQVSAKDQISIASSETAQDLTARDVVQSPTSNTFDEERHLPPHLRTSQWPNAPSQVINTQISVKAAHIPAVASQIHKIQVATTTGTNTITSTRVQANKQLSSIPAISASISRMATHVKTTDANIQDVWTKFMLDKMSSMKVDNKFADKGTTTVEIQPDVSVSSQTPTPAVMTIESHISVLPEPERATAVLELAQSKVSISQNITSAPAIIQPEVPRAVTPPTSGMNKVVAHKNPKTADLDASTAVFAAALLKGNKPFSSFNNNDYRKPLHEVSPEEPRPNGRVRSPSPINSEKSLTSYRFGKIPSPRPIQSPFRLPIDNPHFKITEDSTRFIKHIKNSAPTGKFYVEKKEVPKIDNASSKLPSVQNAPPARVTQSAAVVLIAAAVHNPSSAPKKSALKPDVSPAKFVDVDDIPPMRQTISIPFELPPLTKAREQGPQHSGAWPIHSSLVEVLKDPAKYAEWLSGVGPPVEMVLPEDDAIVPRNSSDSFNYECISDNGVEDEDVRGVLGNCNKGANPAWGDSTWASPWMRFDNSFVHKFVEIWIDQAPHGPKCMVDTKVAEFILGQYPINNATFGNVVFQPESLPDTINCSNEQKRLTQTSQSKSDAYIKDQFNKTQLRQALDRAHSARYLEIERAKIEDTPDLFAPEIDMYVRPVEMKDAEDIRNIYNYYVVNTIIPEDQTEITIEMAQQFIRYALAEKLPILVAVRGKFVSSKPAKPQAYSNRGRKQKMPAPTKEVLPDQEHVIGFASTDRAAYGLVGGKHGMHRYTIDLKLYVDINYTRKGVGRNLLDQLIHILCFGYAWRDSCRFVNQNNDPVYELGGTGRWHMMKFQVPAYVHNDPYYPWLSEWLASTFKFIPGGVNRHWGRTSIAHIPAQFIDIHHLQCEADHECNFDQYV